LCLAGILIRTKAIMGESESLLVRAGSLEREFYAPKRVRGRALD